LNLGDNFISDYGMNSVKSIITTTGVKQLNLASNMISGDGIEVLTETLCKNETLVTLDVCGEFKASWG
jgi:hypothetical protein